MGIAAHVLAAFIPPKPNDTWQLPLALREYGFLMAPGFATDEPQTVPFNQPIPDPPA